MPVAPHGSIALSSPQQSTGKAVTGQGSSDPPGATGASGRALTGHQQ